MSDERPTLKKVTLNGVDVSNYVKSIEATDEFKKYIGICTLVLNNSVRNVLSIDIDNLPSWHVTWQRGVNSPTEEWVFRGEVISGEIDGASYVLECNCRYYEAVRASINYSYDINIDETNGIGSEIYKDLINTHTTLTTTDDVVIETPSNLIITKYVCKNTDVFERADKLAERYNYQHYYDAELDLCVFEPIGYHDTGLTLTVGAQIIEVPKWKSDKSKLCNKVTIKGAEQLVEYTQFSNGDNTDKQTAILEYTPRSVKVYVGSGTFTPSSGTKPSNNESNLKVGGKIGSTSGEYDYNYDDDKRIRTVYFKDTEKGAQPSYKPPVGVNNIEVQMTYALPVQVKGSVESSISEFGVHEKEVESSDIKNFDDAYSYMQSFLNFYSLPFISTTLKVTNAGDIKVGRVYNIIDNISNINKNLVVSKVKKQWPFNFDEVTVGNEIIREMEFSLNVLDSIKRLQEIVAESDDLVVEVIDNTVTVPLEGRYNKLLVKNIAGGAGVYGHPVFGVYGIAKYGATTAGVFLLGHPTFGVLGTSPLGDSYTDPVVVGIVQGNNTYKEYIYDNDFCGNTVLIDTFEMSKDGWTDLYNTTNFAYNAMTDEWSLFLSSAGAKKTFDLTNVNTVEITLDIISNPTSCYFGIGETFDEIDDVLFQGSTTGRQVHVLDVSNYTGEHELVASAIPLSFQEGMFHLINVKVGDIDWNTTTKEITITAGGELTTEDLFLGQTYPQFNLRFADISGDYNVYITGNGGATWQEVTSFNTNVNFLSSNNNGVKLKIVATTETVISNTYKANGSYNLPGIRLRVIE